MHLSWIELDRDALTHNVQQFLQWIPERCAMMVPVKANAYGHGLALMSQGFTQAGVKWLAVHSLEEARQVRSADVQAPLLILGHVALNQLEEAVMSKFRLMLTNQESLQQLESITEKCSTPIYLHLKAETGTHRQGLDPQPLLEMDSRIHQHPHLQLEGVYTHFANIEDTTDHSYAMGQWNTFLELQKKLQNQSLPVSFFHSGASAATLLFPEIHQDIVRPGISAYGLWPSPETYVSVQQRGNPIQLHPILSWKTRITQIKQVPSGAFIGYGCTFRTTHPTRIAVLPLGYSDGYDRRLSNTGHVLIHGQRAPIRGRICMNLAMVDITDIPQAQLEDEVVLLGQQGEEKISAETLASWMGTISYEVLARLPQHLHRQWAPEKT